jgi:hypothetical protein
MRVGSREIQREGLKVREAIKVVATRVGGGHYFSSHCHFCLVDDPVTAFVQRTTEKRFEGKNDSVKPG